MMMMVVMMIMMMRRRPWHGCGYPQIGYDCLRPKTIVLRTIYNLPSYIQRSVTAAVDTASLNLMPDVEVAWSIRDDDDDDDYDYGSEERSIHLISWSL